MTENEMRNFALRDVEGNEIGVFTGKSPRQAALKAANRGYTDIKLRERGTKKVMAVGTEAKKMLWKTPGDIVALAGLKDVRTGDTLSDSQKQVILEKMEFPDPVIEIAIEPKSKADQEKLGVALAKLAAEDPSFRVSTDQESGQTILKGMGELHLDIKVDILKRTYKVDANIGAPQVAFREKITQKVEHDYTHKKQTGGSGQYGRVAGWMEPVRSLVRPVSEGLFAGALDIRKVPSASDRFKFRLSVLFGVWTEGDHRDWNAIREWTVNLGPLLR